MGLSICITAYKSVQYIKKTLDSIYLQDWFINHNDWEVIIGVDGCEETLNKIKSIQGLYKNMRVFMMDHNVGTYITSNTIIKKAKYDWILRFDSDDIMVPGAIRELMKVTNQCDVCRFQRYRMNESETEYSDCDKYHMVGCCLFKKSIWDEFGGYKPWSCSADSDLIRGRVSHFCKVMMLEKKLIYYRISGNSLTNNPDTNLQSDVRKRYLDVVQKEIKNGFKKREDAYIQCETTDCYEVFSDSKEGTIERFPFHRLRYIPQIGRGKKKPSDFCDNKWVMGIEGPLYDARIVRENDSSWISSNKTKLIFTVNFDENPPEVDPKPGYEYICLSDHKFNNEYWKVIVVDKLVKTVNKRWMTLNIKYHPMQYIKKNYQQIMYITHNIPEDYIYYFNKVFGYKLGVIGKDFLYDHEYQSYLDRIWSRVCAHPEEEEKSISRICDEKVKIFD